MLIMFLEKSKGRKSNTNSTIYPQTKRKNTRHPPPPHTHLKKNTKKHQKPKEVEDRAVEERGGASKSTIGTWGEK